MAHHVKILGILHLVFSGLALMAGVVIFLIFGGIAGFLGFSSDESAIAAPILGSIGVFIFGIMLALALPGLAVGIGLLGMYPWARIAGLILSAFDLLHIPFGTMLGIYGFWVLLNPETERLFARR